MRFTDGFFFERKYAIEEKVSTMSKRIKFRKKGKSRKRTQSIQRHSSTKGNKKCSGRIGKKRIKYGAGNEGREANNSGSRCGCEGDKREFIRKYEHILPIINQCILTSFETNEYVDLCVLVTSCQQQMIHYERIPLNHLYLLILHCITENNQIINNFDAIEIMRNIKDIVIDEENDILDACFRTPPPIEQNTPILEKYIHTSDINAIIEDIRTRNINVINEYERRNTNTNVFITELKNVINACASINNITDKYVKTTHDVDKLYTDYDYKYNSLTGRDKQSFYFFFKQLFQIIFRKVILDYRNTNNDEDKIRYRHLIHHIYFKLYTLYQSDMFLQTFH